MIIPESFLDDNQRHQHWLNNKFYTAKLKTFLLLGVYQELILRDILAKCFWHDIFVSLICDASTHVFEYELGFFFQFFFFGGRVLILSLTSICQ